MKKFSDLIVKNRQEWLPEKNKASPGDIVEGKFSITKSDKGRHLAFGWASIAIKSNGEVVEDWQEDIIEPAELESAAYGFVELYREGGEMHERGGAAVLVESVVFTEEKAKAMGIPEEFLPEISPCHAVVGAVTKKAAMESGLVEGIPVVAGALDAACGTLGAGVLYNGETQEQGGQAGGVSICTDTYKADPRLILSHYVVPGTWILQGGTTGGGGVMRWMEREFADYERTRAEELGKSSLVQFNEIAKKVAPGSEGMVFLPYMSGERTPIWDSNAKGVFYGLDFSKTKGHFVRAAMEGIAYSVRHNLEVAKEAGAPAAVLRSMGGSANSLLWTQIKSDVTGKPIIVPDSDTATTLGAVILAGVGVGLHRDFKEAVELTVTVKREHKPNPEVKEVYDRNYEIYLELYQKLKETMKK